MFGAFPPHGIDQQLLLHHMQGMGASQYWETIGRDISQCSLSISLSLSVSLLSKTIRTPAGTGYKY